RRLRLELVLRGARERRRIDLRGRARRPDGPRDETAHLRRVESRLLRDRRRLARARGRIESMPSVPVGTQSAAYVTKRAQFTCARCAFRGEADVTGIGEGAQSFLNEDGTVARRAHEDAERDVARTIRRALCPKCKKRNPGALLGFLTPYLVITGITMAAGFLA